MEEGRGHVHSKGESIQTHIAAECRGEIIFLHYGVEAHRTRESNRGLISPKGRHSRCTRLHRAHLDNLGGYPEGQEWPTESVSHVVGPSIRATAAPTEDVGGPSRAIISPLSSSFRNTFFKKRVYDAVLHQDVQYEVGSSGGWSSHGVHDFLFPVRTGVQILLKAAGSNIPDAHIGKGMHIPPIKVFMDDTTLIMNRKEVVQITLDKLDSLLGRCRMVFKSAKSRSLALSVEGSVKGPGSEKLQDRLFHHRGWRKMHSRQVDLRFPP